MLFINHSLLAVCVHEYDTHSNMNRYAKVVISFSFKKYVIVTHDQCSVMCKASLSACLRKWRKVGLMWNEVYFISASLAFEVPSI